MKWGNRYGYWVSQNETRTDVDWEGEPATAGAAPAVIITSPGRSVFGAFIFQLSATEKN